MAVVNSVQATESLNLVSNNGLVAFSSIASFSTTELIWNASSTSQVRVEGRGINVDPTGTTILVGIIQKVQIDPAKNADFSTGVGVDVVITGLDVPLTSLVVGATAAEKASSFWSTLLEGDQTFLIGNAVGRQIFGDMPGLIAISTTGVMGAGGNDRIIDGGIPAANTSTAIAQYVVGDVANIFGYVSSTTVGIATYHGGNDSITSSAVRGTDVSGDAYRVDSGGKLLGGNDTIQVSYDAAHSNQASGSILYPLIYAFICGDTVRNSGGEVTGGADRIIDLSPVSLSSLVLVGDAAINNGALVGGDDRLTGNSRLCGDAYLSTGGGVLGGNDTLVGSGENNSLFGDVAELAGGTLTGGADRLLGLDGNDRLVGDANRFDFAIGRAVSVLGGNDIAYGGDGGDFVVGDLLALMNGIATGGADKLFGDDANDVVAGDFAFSGRLDPFGLRFTGNLTGGSDYLYGGDGDDNLIGDTSRLQGTGTIACGNDFLSGGDGNDILTGDAFFEFVNGLEQTGTLTGGNDYLVGGLGSDRMVGGGGFDTISFDVSTGAAIILAISNGDGSCTGQGDDTFSGIERVMGSAWSDRIIADVGGFRLFGLQGNDRIEGGDGRDVINGGEGDDFVRGNQGSDDLWGGSGADTFEYSSDDLAGAAGTGRDRIHDFELSDRIDVSGIDANLRV